MQTRCFRMSNPFAPSTYPQWLLAVFWGLFVFLAALPAFAQESEDAERIQNFLEEENALSMDFVTPHTKWAKPYAGGTVKTLFFAPWAQNTTDTREIIELMQRFDLDAQAVYCGPGPRLIGDGRTYWYGGDPEAGTKRALQLLDTPNQVLFINQLKLDALPQAVREKVHQKVIEGAGLVVVGDASLPFTEAQRLETVPDDLPKGQYNTLGKGRVVLLPSREKLTYSVGWDIQFDYQMAQQGRALLWAANRMPKTQLHLQSTMECFPRSGLPTQGITLSCEGGDSNTKFQIVLRRWDGEKIDLSSSIKAGVNPMEITLPLVQAGDYHLEVLAVCNGMIQNWATHPVRVTADSQVAAVVLDKDWAEIGETLKGRIRLEGDLPSKDRVQIRLVDKHNRIIAHQEARVSSGDIPFSFAISFWMPMLLRVEAVILDGPNEVASAYEFALVTKRHRDQFNFVVWNTPAGDLGPYAVQSLAQYGTTAILQGGPPPLWFAENEMSYVPYAASFRDSSHTTTAMLDPKTGWLKSGCIHDADKLQQTVAKTVAASKRAREMGTLVYSLGDENAVRSSCLSPFCLDAYRCYLKDLYGDIAALNREWNANYARFEEIQLLSEGALPSANAPEWFKTYFAEWQKLYRTDSEGAKGDDLEKQIVFGNTNEEMRALQAENYPRWYDRQSFQNQTYLEWCKRYKKEFKQLDPQAWTGFEGTDSFSIRRITTRSRQGGDLDAFVRELDYFGPYIGPANEVVRSIARPGFPMGNWIGYEPDADTLLREYWSQVTDNMNTVQWWRWDNLDGYHGYVTPSFTPFPAVRELLQDTQVVRDGLGTLLMRSSMYDDGVAMLYSLPSTYIAFFDGNQTYGDYKRDHDVWSKLIHKAGLQFRYVTDRMMRLGEFDAKRYKVLILPLAFAMTPEEATVVRQFVENGGTVIADVRPALYDGHCKPLEQGLLDDVFGIKRSGHQNAIPVDRVNINGEVNGGKVALKWGNWHGKDIYPQMMVDPTVEVSTGKGLGDAFHIHYWAGLKSPLCVLNSYGKGRAILLNFSVFNAPAEKLIADLLASGGVVPEIKVTPTKPEARKSIEVTRWRNGETELFALLGDYQGEVKISLPGTRNVYDLKGHTFVGQTAAFTTAVRPNRASFFTLSPQPIGAPVLKQHTVSARCGNVVKASVGNAGGDGLHAVRIHATTPSGEHAEWLDQTLIVGTKTEPLMLPFALNDPVGDWSIEATDLFSNQTGSMTIKVQR